MLIKSYLAFINMCQLKQREPSFAQYSEAYKRQIILKLHFYSRKTEQA